MSTEVYGIVACESPDNVGETLLIDGIDISKLNKFIDEHPEDPKAYDIIGAIKVAKKIYSEQDCRDEKQIRAWKHCQVPFVYVEGVLADNEGHPNAQSAAALLKFASRPDIKPHLQIGLSIDGGIDERKNEQGQPDENGKILSKTRGFSGAFTVKPCNPKCAMWLANDLTKSDLTAPAPERYWKAIKQQQASRSISESVDFKLHIKMEKLKKSLNDYFSAFTGIKCKKCGEATRFFKSSKEMPNGCKKCGSYYSMTDIWKSLNS
jgi:ribosomal protein S27E